MPNIDISRDATDLRKHYDRVHMQQGRVLTDDDFNEAERLDAEDARRVRVDVIGPAGSPDDGFKLNVYRRAACGPIVSERGHLLRRRPATRAGERRAFQPSEGLVATRFESRRNSNPAARRRSNLTLFGLMFGNNPSRQLKTRNFSRLRWEVPTRLREFARCDAPAC